MIAEYRDVQGRMAKRTVLATVGRYRLVHSTSGWECAGSCARSTDEKWGVFSDIAGTPHGRWFRTESEARELLQQWSKS